MSTIQKTFALAAFTLALTATAARAEPAIQHVVVIAMENKASSQIYGNTAEAPYINNVLMKNFTYATDFRDRLPTLNSEPHYIMMEAARNKFTDATFSNDADPSATNSTSFGGHLVTQLEHGVSGLSWMTYQEDITSTTGQCPVHSDKFYAAKHNPFVFFQDIAGNPPSKTAAHCIKHTKPYTSFAADLSANRMAKYVFISPNLCHDMHGATGCPSGSTNIKAGDTWLSQNVPRIITWAYKNGGVLFIIWDEGSKGGKMPFLAIGPGVKRGYANSVAFDHRSLVKTVENIFGLPELRAAKPANDFSSVFKPSFYP